ncbi:MAG: ATP-binding cassette domain-containing protein, partial [Chitinophagaceae bacterium]|nr:ATP-binding cassette domain-containing protein [Chitinophagaceae bacterium]
MIEVKNIRKSFNGNVILQDVSATMEAGKCNLIIGASGSGKTVFMKCLVGLFQPDSGDIFYNGQLFTSMTVTEKKDIRK